MKSAVAIVLCLAPCARAAPLQDVLHENGDADGSNGYSNATTGVFGFARLLLDDFVVPDGETWTVAGLRHNAIWNTLSPGSGTGMLLQFWRGDAPSEFVGAATITSYDEVATGRTMFDRPEYEAWTQYEPLDLPPGYYWLEGAAIGPENNYWLVRQDVTHEECWVDYSDSCRCPGTWHFGGEGVDLAWRLLGTRRCAADLDGSGAMDFGDVLAVLAAWGPCGGCPEDLDGSGSVDFADLLAVLAAWGPCGSA